MGGSCSTHGDTRNVYKILLRKNEGRPPGRPSGRCEVIIKMYV